MVDCSWIYLATIRTSMKGLELDNVVYNFSQVFVFFVWDSAYNGLEVGVPFVNFELGCWLIW